MENAAVRENVVKLDSHLRQVPVTEWRSLLCRFGYHTYTMWMINYDPPSPELGWTKQRRGCVVCGRCQEASLL